MVVSNTETDAEGVNRKCFSRCDTAASNSLRSPATYNVSSASTRVTICLLPSSQFFASFVTLSSSSAPRACAAYASHARLIACRTLSRRNGAAASASAASESDADPAPAPPPAAPEYDVSCTAFGRHRRRRRCWSVSEGDGVAAAGVGDGAGVGGAAALRCCFNDVRSASSCLSSFSCAAACASASLTCSCPCISRSNCRSSASLSNCCFTACVCFTPDAASASWRSASARSCRATAVASCADFSSRLPWAVATVSTLVLRLCRRASTFVTSVRSRSSHSAARRRPAAASANAVLRALRKAARKRTQRPMAERVAARFRRRLIMVHRPPSPPLRPSSHTPSNEVQIL
eukprot:Rhum_TRINITY_DN7972_c0_g1::Rhum_TRINITY_DN7972_c0_g1_i1::g.25485::m.25485